MNYDGLQKSYWQEQIARIEELRKKISSRPKIGDGQTIPDDEALSIGDGKRLNLAIMFIDICGFSSRPMETLEEQDLTLRVLNLFFTEMIRISEEYGGHVEKNTGDGLMIYFKDEEGSPQERGTKRAIAAALTMMAANEYLINPILRATPTKEIEFRVSLDYGPVTIAKLGSPRRFTSNAAIGSTANFASKMLRHAKASDIILGESARNQLPIYWQTNWTEIIDIATGWHYLISGKDYSIYRYIGRWTLSA